jgi:hypothetical protein
MRRRYQLRFGAELTSTGTVFRLCTPRATAVSVLLESGERIQLPTVREAGVWFSVRSTSAAIGGRYRYLGDGVGYPDPASRYAST